MSDTKVRANQPAVDLYAVTLNWVQEDEGSYSDYVHASSHAEACVKVAEAMADQRGYVDENETPVQKREWINCRAWDQVDCHLVKESLEADLVALFGDELFPDGVKRCLNLEALRVLLAEHRNSLLPPAEVRAVEQLAFHSVESGFCRVYYKRPKGTLCCFQLDTRNTFKLYHCSRDGEPEHEISLQNKAVIALPEDNGCSLITSFRAWWEQQNKQPAA